MALEKSPPQSIARARYCAVTLEVVPATGRPWNQKYLLWRRAGTVVRVLQAVPPFVLHSRA